MSTPKEFADAVSAEAARMRERRHITDTAKATGEPTTVVFDWPEPIDAKPVPYGASYAALVVGDEPWCAPGRWPYSPEPDDPPEPDWHEDDDPPWLP